jgi:hypothetical protein
MTRPAPPAEVAGLISVVRPSGSLNRSGYFFVQFPGRNRCTLFLELV